MSLLVFEIFGWIFICSGSLLTIIGGLGLLRLPDFFSRIHAAGITDTMGAWLIIIGLMFSSTSWLVTAKLVMLLVFLLLTSPLASHALANAAYTRGLRPLIGPDLNPGGDDD